MTALRTLSERPELLVDDRRAVVTSNGSRIGFAGPLGRHRVIAALPFNKSRYVQLEPWRALADADGCLIADPGATVLGSAALFVHRMLYANKTANTRRL